MKKNNEIDNAIKQELEEINQDRLKLQEEVKNDYNIKDLLGVGSSALVYFATNKKSGEECVVKIYKHQDDLNRIKTTYKTLASVVKNYSGELLIEQPKFYTNYAVASYLGEQYCKKSKRDDKYFATILADFLAYLHNLSDGEQISNSNLDYKRLEKHTEGYVDGFTKKIKAKLRYLKSMADKYIYEKDPKVFCHGDIRGCNLLVTKDDKLALIDFELFSKHSVYFDFIPSSWLEYNFSPTFVATLFEEYNKKSKFKLNKEKFFSFYSLNMFKYFMTLCTNLENKLTPDCANAILKKFWYSYICKLQKVMGLK